MFVVLILRLLAEVFILLILYAVLLRRASDFLFEEALEMLRVLEAEHVGNLLNACVRLEQGVLGHFNDFQMYELPGRLSCLGLHQVSEIVW